MKYTALKTASLHLIEWNGEVVGQARRDPRFKLFKHDVRNHRQVELAGIGNCHLRQFHEFRVAMNDVLDAMGNSIDIGGEKPCIEAAGKSGWCNRPGDEYRSGCGNGWDHPRCYPDQRRRLAIALRSRVLAP